MRELERAPSCPHSSRARLEEAKIDAEDVGQVNPFTFDQAFLDLLWNNVTAVITNYWAAGYPSVITGSLLDGDTHASFCKFRARLPDDVCLYVVHLTASKQVRDQRRIDRAKPSSKEWRDRVDASYPSGDTSLSDNASDYRYIPVDNSTQPLAETIAAITQAIPEIYKQRHITPFDACIGPLPSPPGEDRSPGMPIDVRRVRRPTANLP